MQNVSTSGQSWFLITNLEEKKNPTKLHKSYLFQFKQKNNLGCYFKKVLLLLLLLYPGDAYPQINLLITTSRLKCHSHEMDQKASLRVCTTWTNEKGKFERRKRTKQPFIVVAF